VRTEIAMFIVILSECAGILFLNDLKVLAVNIFQPLSRSDGTPIHAMRIISVDGISPDISVLVPTSGIVPLAAGSRIGRHEPSHPWLLVALIGVVQAGGGITEVAGEFLLVVGSRRSVNSGARKAV
jgi:hypothetical protein